MNRDRGSDKVECLCVDRISKRFGGLLVFDDITFDLPRSEVLGVIGPNGAGKTTLINVICGMLRPSSGEVMLENRRITSEPFHTRSRLGVVRSFQQTNTFRTASVAENIARAERFSQCGETNDIGASELVHEFGLTEHMSETSGKLPYGLQKLLGLLMAYVARPKYLLLDEPAAGLERRERGNVDKLVGQARGRLGCGVLIVEHDMDLIRRLCPQIIVLESGRVLTQGAPEEVLARREVIEAYLGDSEETVC